MPLGDGKRIVVYRSPELKIIYLPCTKNASTSILTWLIDLSCTVRGDRVKGLRRERASNFLIKEVLADSVVDDYLRSFADYFAFGVCRNPYERIASAYRNKINRLFKKKLWHLYLRAKLLHFLDGPSAWGADRAALRFMHSAMGFDAFVRAIQRHGPGLDSHYQLQFILMRPDLFRAIFFFRIEDLPGSLLGSMQDHFDHHKIGLKLAFYPLPFCNKMPGPRSWPTLYDQKTLDIVSVLYSQDFDAFGYDRVLNLDQIWSPQGCNNLV
jgi:hypothetical protein